MGPISTTYSAACESVGFDRVASAHVSRYGGARRAIFRPCCLGRVAWLGRSLHSHYKKSNELCWVKSFSSRCVPSLLPFPIHRTIRVLPYSVNE
uniref:Uncharacterized protein n=1 Tax=Picea glauca TaxID=3330 RepID=A0A101M5A5_PICGL|nr:hypothetical protein ABT39_MTgene1188 [Picea glauca]